MDTIKAGDPWWRLATFPIFPSFAPRFTYHNSKMARSPSVFQSTSISTQPHPYRLTTPPLRRSGSPIAGVARGRRVRLGERASFGTTRPASPEILTEPESSPLRPGQHLHRTYAVGNLGPIPEQTAEPTPSQNPVSLNDPVPQPLPNDASTTISSGDGPRNDAQTLSLGMYH